MRRSIWIFAACSLVAAAVVGASPASDSESSDSDSAASLPARIDFPAGWRAEGIFIDREGTFYAGDTSNGAIYRGDVRTGTGAVLVPGVAGRSAFGVYVDKRNRIFVAGGSTGHAYVFNATTGALIADYTLAPAAPRFINDVVVTRSGAYFTNTAGAPVLFRIPIGKHGELGPSAETLTLAPSVAGLNGIEATHGGKTLVVVSITLNKLYTVNPQTGATQEIVTDQPVLRGDGLILQGHTLYVAENLPSAAFPGVQSAVAVVRLPSDLKSGSVVARLNNAADPLVNSATMDRFGDVIYVVRRDAPAPAPAAFHLTRVNIPGGDEDDDDGGSD